MVVMTAVLAMLPLALFAQGYGRGQGRASGQKFAATCLQMPAQDVNDTEKAALSYMREEEKLAHDVYRTLYQKWNLRVFNNISNSESRHTAAVQSLLNKYQLTDPVQDDGIGIFANTELSGLYGTLVAQGEKSLKDALLVGCTIEDLDIADLNERIKETDNDDIRCVFENLKKGSENHMRAFMNQLKQNGGAYQAQYISQQELDAILQASSGSGFGRGGRGRRF